MSEPRPSLTPVDPQRVIAAEQRCEILTDVTRSVLYERECGTNAALVSRSMQDVFGYPAEQARDGGLGWWLARVHEDDHGIVRERFREDRDEHDYEWSVEYRVQRADGTWAVVLDQGRLLPAEPGRGARAFGVITDVSAMKAMQAQLQHAQRLELIGRLAAGVSHDFNNVLSAIRGFTDLLIDSTPAEDERSEDLREISSLVDRASELTQNLLGLTRQREHGQTRLVNVADELRRLAPTLRILIGSSLTLAIDTDTPLPSTAIDPGLFAQVILNLASNARDATAEGGSITIRTSAVGPADAPLVRVEVRDNGSGIAPHLLARVFEPFFTTKPEAHGSGLGLWLVRQIVEGASGRLGVESTPFEGTVVWMEFPAVDEVPSADDLALTPPREDEGAISLLLIEDEISVRYITKRILERAGFRVHATGSGKEGLQVLRDRGADIGVIVTDLHMPGLAGAELVDRLRRAAPDVGCLVVSGVAERFKPAEAAPDRLVVLSKPCEAGVLVRWVDALARATSDRRASTN